MGKTAIITGGSTGIGAGIALQLAKNGYDIGISVCRDRMKAMTLCKEIINLGRKVFYCTMDLTDIDTIAPFFEKARIEFEHLDLFVNNAGITLKAPFLSCDASVIDTLYEVDYKGAYLVMQKAAQWMIETQTKGSIVVISSNNGIAHYAGVSVYGSIKAAMNKLVEHIAIEIAPHGIRINTIAPGWTDTGSSRLDEKESTFYKIPLKRWVQTQEIGDAVVFLSSPSAASITGATLVMDGGACLLSDKMEKYEA